REDGAPIKPKCLTRGFIRTLMPNINPGVLLALSLFVTGCTPIGGAATGSVMPTSPAASQQVDEPAATASSISITKDFVARIVGDNEDVWDSLFDTMGLTPYAKPTVVIFSGRTQSSCGVMATSAGPSYCERDRKIYIDSNYFSGSGKHFVATEQF